MKSAKYTLHEVKTARDEREFLDLPRRLYKGDRNFVSPLDPAIKSVFDPSQNDLFAIGEAIRWIARDAEGKVVGRIAAFYDKDHCYLETQPTGGCGFFEAIDDQELANLLFDAARDWLKERGMEAMDGPVNFGPRNAWWGLLVNGYEFSPLIENPYNPPYYKELFENYGFQNFFNQHTYIWRMDTGTLPERSHERAARLYETPGYRVTHLTKKMDLGELSETIRIIYNKAWAMFSGVKPMTREQADEMLATLKPIIDPEAMFFAYYNDEPIGFFVMFPDLNRIVGRFNGKFGWWQKLMTMWYLKVRKKSDRLFGLLFAITPEYQGKGVESAIMCYIHDEFVQKRNKHYKAMEFAWIGDFNPVMNRMIETYVNATKHKMHTTYRYLFDRTKEFHRQPRMGVKRREE